MLHQLDLFGGEPVKLEGKIAPLPKKHARIIKEKQTDSEKNESVNHIEEPASSNYSQQDLFDSITTLPQTEQLAENPGLISTTAVKEVAEEKQSVKPETEEIHTGKVTIEEIKVLRPSPLIPPDEVLFTKQYYPISEVAIMFGVNISLLRYWEKEFDIIKPRKNRKGDRLFRPADIKNLKIIFHLLKEKKYTIKGAREFLKKGTKVAEKFEAVEVLKNIRTMLVELKSALT